MKTKTEKSTSFKETITFNKPEPNTETTDDEIRISFQIDYEFIKKPSNYKDFITELEKILHIENIKTNYTLEVIYISKDSEKLDKNNFHSFNKAQSKDIVEIRVEPVDKVSSNYKFDLYIVGNAEETPYILHKYDSYISLELKNRSKKKIEQYSFVLNDILKTKYGSNPLKDIEPGKTAQLFFEVDFNPDNLKPDGSVAYLELKSKNKTQFKVPLYIKLITP